MNDNRKFTERTPALIELLNYGLPLIVIQKYFEISPSTAREYVAKLKETEEWTGQVPTTGEAIPKMLMLLAHLQVGRSPQQWVKFVKVIRERLLSILHEVLDIKKISQLLSFGARPLIKLMYFGFTPEVPEGYRNFINYLNNPYPGEVEKLGDSLWPAYLKKIANGNIELIPYPTLSAWQEEITAELINELSDTIRPDILPIIPGAVCEKIENMIFPAMTKARVEIIKAYFGIGEKKLTMAEIADKRDVSVQRISQQFYAGIRQAKMTHRLESILALPLTWEKVMEMLPEKPVLGQDQIPLNQALKIRLIDLNLTTRSLNGLELAEIKYLGDLQEFSERDLLRIRNMGKDSVQEIKELAAKYGISLRD